MEVNETRLAGCALHHASNYITVRASNHTSKCLGKKKS